MADSRRSVRLEALNALATSGKWRAEGLHAHPRHLLLWFTRGQGRMSINGLPRVYGPNTIAFVPAGMPHAFEVRQGLFGTAAYFEDDPLVRMPSMPVHLRMRDALEQGQFVSHFENVQREVASDAHAAGRALTLHAGLLGIWLERQAIKHADEARPSAAERLVQRYMGLLEKRYAAKDGVGDLAAQLGVTPTHLTRCCKSVAGVSAHALLSDRVMYAARDMLVTTGHPVKEVAQALGFTSAAYFTRAFQSATGQTPTDFRRGAGR
ncbi:MAG: AraC family transcriptional regulator [Shimia sp.]